MEVLLFGGTAEGRALARWLQTQEIPTMLCVATEYGAELSPEGGTLCVHTGRMDRTAMEQMMKAHPFTCCVDATHPYAVEVSGNIAAACEQTGLSRHRLLRRAGEEIAGEYRVSNARAAADLVEQMPGNILLTTGSKDLDVYAKPGLRERCFPRVLPTVDSLERCLTLGFPQKQVICMQGPFSNALNLAMLDQLDIAVLVTKDTGTAGGFAEKADAVRARGCTLVVIDRPTVEVGMTLEELKQFLTDQLGGEIL